MNLQISGTILGPLGDVLTSGDVSATLTSGDGGLVSLVRGGGPPQAFSMLDERWRTLLLRFSGWFFNHCDDFAVPWLKASKVGVELF